MPEMQEMLESPEENMDLFGSIKSDLQEMLMVLQQYQQETGIESAAIAHIAAAIEALMAESGDYVEESANTAPTPPVVAT